MFVVELAPFFLFFLFFLDFDSGLIRLARDTHGKHAWYGRIVHDVRCSSGPRQDSRSYRADLEHTAVEVFSRSCDMHVQARKGNQAFRCGRWICTCHDVCCDRGTLLQPDKPVDHYKVFNKVRKWIVRYKNTATLLYSLACIFDNVVYTH